MPAGIDQPSAAARPNPHHRSDRDLHEGARDRDPSDREQLGEREMQADAEHQEDDANLGELGRETRIGDKARRERADRDACEEIADERRYLQALGDGAEDEGEDDARDNRRDQGRRLVQHACTPRAGFGSRGSGAAEELAGAHILASSRPGRH
jgi:hypothetical protein